MVRTSKNIFVKRSRNVSRRVRQELLFDSTSLGKSSCPTKVDDAVCNRDCGENESLSEGETPIGKDICDQERCSLKREAKDPPGLFAEGELIGRVQWAEGGGKDKRDGLDC